MLILDPDPVSQIICLKLPNSVVNTSVRRHCEGLEFPSAHPIKFFCVVPGGNGKTKYRLMQYKKQSPGSERISSSPSPEKDLLPEEKMLKAYQAHISNVSNQLLDTILEQDPKFFEELVVKLLAKLGYGYGNDAGKIVGKSHDGGETNKKEALTNDYTQIGKRCGPESSENRAAAGTRAYRFPGPRKTEKINKKNISIWPSLCYNNKKETTCGFIHNERALPAAGTAAASVRSRSGGRQKSP